jgi:hypothetical protein
MAGPGKVQTLRYVFYWVCFAFSSWYSWKILSWTIGSWGPSMTTNSGVRRIEDRFDWLVEGLHPVGETEVPSAGKERSPSSPVQRLQTHVRETIKQLLVQLPGPVWVDQRPLAVPTSLLSHTQPLRSSAPERLNPAEDCFEPGSHRPSSSTPGVMGWLLDVPPPNDTDPLAFAPGVISSLKQRCDLASNQ